MQLFYQPGITQASGEVMFDKEESRHIAKVLRKGKGDLLWLTNGEGYFFEAILQQADPKQCLAFITKAEKQPPLSYSLHMAVAPTKGNDRYEWFLEKATEIGVTEITPVICDHSERKVIKMERYEKILQGAMKQSLRAFFPRLNPATTFTDFIASEKKVPGIKGIAHCETGPKESLKTFLKPSENITLLIGPEGDFSASEIQLALQQDFIPISLGAHRLRTETAALVACHSVSFLLEH